MTKRLVLLVLALTLLVGTAAQAVYDPAKETPSKWEGDVTTITFTSRLPNIVLEDNPLLAKIEEAIGVRLEISTLDKTEYNNLLAVQIGSGDIPDLIYLWNSSADINFQKWAKDGLLLDLETLKDKLPNAFDWLKESDLAFGRVPSLDNRLFGLPRMQALKADAIPYRGDWLEKFGMDIPVTPDDLYAYCIKCAKEDPDGNGKDDTWGLYVTSTGDKGGGLLDVNVREGFGILPETIAYQVVPAQDGFMNLMDWYRKLYADGGLYPEFYLATDVYDDNAKFQAGTVGCFVKTTTVDHTMAGADGALRQAFPDARVVAGYPLQPNGTTMADQDKFFHYNSNNCWGVFAISSKASPEAVDAACRFLDWGCTEEGSYYLNVGIEGVSFKSWDPEKRIRTPWTPEEREADPRRATNYQSYMMVQQSWKDGSKISFGGATPEEQAEYVRRYDFLFRNYIPYTSIVTYPGYTELSEQNAEVDLELTNWMVQYICGRCSREEFTGWLDGTYKPAWAPLADIIAAIDGPKK